MVQTAIVVIVGSIGGIAVGVQSPIAGAMSQRVGMLSTSFLIHLSGLVITALLLFSRGGEKIQEWRSLPWYMLGAGVFGVILYITISFTLPRLGGTMMITLIIIGELLAGVVVDHFGWFGVPVHPIDISRLAGILLLIGGGFLISR
jgi:transporter family-2 protein